MLVIKNFHLPQVVLMDVMKNGDKVHVIVLLELAHASLDVWEALQEKTALLLILVYLIGLQLNVKKGKYIPMLQPGLSGAELPFCVCPPGWEGLDCSICSTDDACSTPYNLDGTCDRSFNFSASLSTEKAFDCNITDVDFILLLDSVPQMPFHYFGNNNSATMQLFLKPTGPPVLFTCELTECTYETSLSMQKLNCNLTSCVCSTWCSSMLADIVASITSTSTLTCDNSSQECTYYQREMSTYTNSLQMACDTSSCV